MSRRKNACWGQCPLLSGDIEWFWMPMWVMSCPIPNFLKGTLPHSYKNHAYLCRIICVYDRCAVLDNLIGPPNFILNNSSTISFQGRLDLIRVLFEVVSSLDIKPSMQSYAAVLECCGRHSKMDTDLLTKVLQDIRDAVNIFFVYFRMSLRCSWLQSIRLHHLNTRCFCVTEEFVNGRIVWVTKFKDLNKAEWVLHAVFGQ